MQNNTTAINEQCLRWLTVREHSQQELLTKLIAKGFTQEDSLPVLANLIEQGWQSDSRYAHSYSRYRLNKGYGAVFISYQLKQKGVNTDIINEALQTVCEDWLEVIERVYQKKYSTSGVLTRENWAKRSRFLMQRGFESYLITKLFNTLIK
jgi:regulatory protein